MRSVAVRCLSVALACAVVSCGTDSTQPSANPPEGTAPSAVFGIAAESGPSERSITISWSPVDSASTYALYFGTSPGVTPGNGQRIAGLPTSFTHTQLAANATYYYIVAAVNGDVEGAPSAEVSATPKAGVALHVETPTAGEVVDATLPVVADLTAAQAMRSVFASVGSVSASLMFDASIGRWTGTLPLGAFESPSARTINVTGFDVAGNFAEANLIVRLDRPPVVTVSAPPDQAVASPSVHIAATCTDDFRTGCAALLAYVDGSRAAPLVAGSAQIDSTVSLAQFTVGSDVQIVIEGIDSAGQVVRVLRTLRRQ